MKLDSILADVSSQLDQQRGLGIEIRDVTDVPETGPTNNGVWFRIPNVSAVFVDMKSSTKISAGSHQDKVALAYTYFVRAAAVIFDGFGARYVDIQGDGLFGLFSGKGSIFSAAACAITIKTAVEGDIAESLRRDRSIDLDLTAGIGMDRGTVMVRRLGTRHVKLNEVWVGKPVNMSAKLSSLAGSNELAVSDRVFRLFGSSSPLQQRIFCQSCGCGGGVRGRGLDAQIEDTTYLWSEEQTPRDLGLDFSTFHRLKTKWCSIHGPEFCEALISGKRPRS